MSSQALVADSRAKFESQKSQPLVKKAPNLKFVVDLFKLNQEAQSELSRIDSKDFDIFNLRDATNGNELVSMLGYLVVQRSLLDDSCLDFEKLINYITAI
jgi:hypothetical protein